mmetsp:Transcript_45912/g.99734  ORF Transcript_45912/g.99734 Transcript_45912/m.99734 type:complete len:207 (-) Transcript_45912:334-954(-)
MPSSIALLAPLVLLLRSLGSLGVLDRHAGPLPPKLVVQSHLLKVDAQHSLLDRVRADQIVHLDRPCLAEAVYAVLGLSVVVRVKGEIQKHHAVCRRQVEAQSPGLRGEKEDVYARIGSLESSHNHGALSNCRGSIKAEVLDPCADKGLADQIQELRVLREDQGLPRSPRSAPQQLQQLQELARTLFDLPLADREALRLISGAKLVC